MTRVAIEILSGAAAGQRSEFELDAIRIGRAGSNDLVVDDERVAGEHARIVVGVERVSLEDLGELAGNLGRPRRRAHRPRRSAPQGRARER